MKKIYLLLLFSVFFVLYCQAQSRHTIFFNSGYTFNPSTIKLNEEIVEKSRGFVFTVGGTYKLFTFKSIYTEIGLATKNIFASGEIRGNGFSSRTLRVAVPIRIVVPIIDKWEISNGFIFQNNVDFRKIDLRLRDKYSWRVDWLSEVKYLLNEQWILTAGLSLSLRNMPDPFFINDPKTAIVIGTARRINLAKAKKPKP